MRILNLLLCHLGSEANSGEPGEGGAWRGIANGWQSEPQVERLKPLIRTAPRQSGNTKSITNTESDPAQPKEQPGNESKTQRSHPLR